MVTASVDARQDEREVRLAMREKSEELGLAVRLLARKLASLHACILTEPDGGCADVGCADVDVDACDRGCVSCWRVWAEMEAGCLAMLRKRNLELERQRAGERRRPEVPVVPEDMDLDAYMKRYGAD